MYISAFVNGALLGGALIIAIGAQNMFVLRQGMARDQVLTVALLSSTIDAGLIVLGALGLGSLIATMPWLVPFASWGGAAFLIVFGCLSFYQGLRPKKTSLETKGDVTSSFKKAVLMTLAFGLLNPHVYLDTVILVGGIAASYALDLRLFFVGGAVLSSFLWFFSIAYGARTLTPLLQHPAGARILDFAVASMMFIVAANLIVDQLASS
ncbi:MAG: LysE family transporter [Sneathiella sp.]|nr:LysE family transporter [Sneathiella sp.]